MRLLAFHSSDAAVLRSVEADIRSSGGFDWVGRPPAPHWLVGHSGTAQSGRRDGAFFVEGGCRLSDVDPRELARRTEENSLQSLPGDFTFACFRGSSEAFFVRSAAGTAPLYYWRGATSFGFASSLTDLTRYFPEEPRLDRLACAILTRFAFMPPDARTPIEAVRLLPPGSSLTWKANGSIAIRTWWAPPPMDEPRGRSFEAHSHELEAALVGGLGRSLDTSGRNLLTLSGGFDSSVLAWLAGKVVGRDFHCLTLTPPPERESASAEPRISRLIRDLRPNVLRTWAHEVSAQARFALLREAPFSVWPVAHPALCLLPGIAAEVDLRCLFGGEGCDEILGGGAALLDWASSTSLRGAFTLFPGALTRTRAVRLFAGVRVRQQLRRVPLLSAAQPSVFLSPELQAEYFENARQEQRAFAVNAEPRPYLSHRLRHAAAGTVQNWEVCARLGIRRVFPFLGREVLELAYRCDPTELTGSVPKRLVRHAVSRSVPEELARLPKAAWHDRTGSLPWREALPVELAGIVRESWLERPPSRVPAPDALRLQALLNMIRAIRTCREQQRESRHVNRQ